MSEMFDRPRRVHPEGSYIGRLLAAADAALAAPPDIVLPPFPWLPPAPPIAANVQRTDQHVTEQYQEICA